MPRARKKIVEEVEEIEEDEDEEEAPKPKRRRGRPAKKAAARKAKPKIVEEEELEDEDEELEDEDEEEAPKPKRGRGRPAKKAESKAPKRDYAEDGAVWDELDNPLTTRVSYDPEESRTLRSGSSKQGQLLEYMTTGPRKKRGATIKQIIAHMEDVEDGKYDGKGESIVKWWVDNGYLLPE